MTGAFRSAFIECIKNGMKPQPKFSVGDRVFHNTLNRDPYRNGVIESVREDGGKNYYGVCWPRDSRAHDPGFFMPVF